MYIRKTTTKKAADGNQYPTFRLVASERVNGKVKQRTLLHIGSSFDLDAHLWLPLCKRIDDILTGKLSLLPVPHEIEKYAQEFATRIIAEGSLHPVKKNAIEEDNAYEEVNVASMQLLQPRSVGVEHVALHGAQLLQLPQILHEVGFSEHQVTMATAGIVGRMAKPGSERATWNWLENQSALEELLNVDFSKNSIMGLYRVSDQLVQRKENIEQRLFSNIRSLFSLEETVTLYDLTNTYFEGEMKGNESAARGFSKEKRSDCPLLTLGLILDGSGFIKKSQMFAGNAAEAGTMQAMLKELDAPAGALVVMDRGIATKANLEWLVASGHHYVVVSRKLVRTFDMSKAQTIRTAQEQELLIYRELAKDGAEAWLYCYSAKRDAKEQAIVNRFVKNFEDGLKKLAGSLAKPRTNKRKDAILQRLGRLVEKSHGISRHYSITVTDNADTKAPEAPLLATSVVFEKKPVPGSIATHPGVYCLRTNALWLDAEKMWRTYIMLTDLEAVFRSLKSELGLRPVYHQTSLRGEGHLFITVLAYQCVQAVRNNLKLHGIYDSWRTLRETLSTQQRITVSFKQRNGSTLHIRKASLAEAAHQRIYDALGINKSPGGVKRFSVPGPSTNV